MTLLTRDEACEALGLKKRQLQYLTRDGHLQTVIDGRRTYVNSESILSYLEANMRRAQDRLHNAQRVIDRVTRARYGGAR